MSLERAKAHLARYGEEDRIREFNVSSATVELAAQALGCEPGRIAKTLSFKLKKQDAVLLIVTAGDAKIDNQKYKALFGEKATMLTPEEAIERVGHAIGGVCPFGINEGVAVYLDDSLKRFGTVYPACGSPNSAIELSLSELETYSGFCQWIDIGKNQQPE